VLSVHSTTWCTGTSDLRHFGPKTFSIGAEVSIGHFGTTVKIRDTSASVSKCLGHFGTTYTSYTEVSHYFIYLRKITLLITYDTYFGT